MKKIYLVFVVALSVQFFSNGKNEATGPANRVNFVTCEEHGVERFTNGILSDNSGVRKLICEGEHSVERFTYAELSDNSALGGGICEEEHGIERFANISLFDKGSSRGDICEGEHGLERFSKTLS